MSVLNCNHKDPTSSSLDDTFCLHGCALILLACPGSFCHSLVLTSTAEPSGAITTDLASHFQCRDGRPLLSVRAVPSSAWITSLPPPLPLSSPITPNLPLPPSYKKGKKKKIILGFFFSFLQPFCRELSLRTEIRVGKTRLITTQRWPVVGMQWQPLRSVNSHSISLLKYLLSRPSLSN